MTTSDELFFSSEEDFRLSSMLRKLMIIGSQKIISLYKILCLRSLNIDKFKCRSSTKGRKIICRSLLAP